MKNPKHVVLTALAAAALAIAMLIYASPYIALHSIKAALDAKDSTALSQFVDFPELRENVKGQLMSSLASRLPGSGSDEEPALGGIGQAIGGMVVGAAVDQLVSPAGVMMMMRSGRFGPRLPDAADAQAPDASKGSREGRSRGLSVRYQSFGQVRVFRKDDPATAFIFRRDGLIGWKLVNVDMG